MLNNRKKIIIGNKKKNKRRRRSGENLGVWKKKNCAKRKRRSWWGGAGSNEMKENVKKMMTRNIDNEEPRRSNAISALCGRTSQIEITNEAVESKIIVLHVIILTALSFSEDITDSSFLFSFSCSGLSSAERRPSSLSFPAPPPSIALSRITGKVSKLKTSLERWL